MTNREIWKDVVGFEGAYEVSDRGRVRSLDRVYTQKSRKGLIHKHHRKGQLLRPGRMTEGHLSVVLGRKSGSHCVHELVLCAFVGPRPVGCEARHLNGKPGSNKLTNLQWATRFRNSQDKKYHNGAGNYKLAPSDVRKIKRALSRGFSGVFLAREFDVSSAVISSIKHGRIHKDIVL